MAPRLSRLLFLLLAPGVAACAQSPSASGTASTAQATSPASAEAPRPMRVTEVAGGFEHPWSVALLPDGGFLVTERPGRLRHVSAAGDVSPPIPGVPDVFAQGQGGLLDVALAPDFATSRRIYLTYAEPGADGTAGTAAGFGVLAGDGDALRLEGFTRIYQQQPKVRAGVHFGSRLAFDGDGHVFISQGDRSRMTAAQALEGLIGKLVRLEQEGQVPADNPFVDHDDARPETWSYGHRNIQGMAVDPRTGTLWTSEHGPRGGDEVNLPVAGGNFGWPLATHGMDYRSGEPYAETIGQQAPGTIAPHHVWPVSPGLSGMAFLVGHPGSPWNDSLFLGALAQENLIRLSLDGDRIVGEERLLADRGARIRDVRVGPDGAVYVLTDHEDGTLLRLDAPTTD
mgnify:CR=1 FL=1